MSATDKQRVITYITIFYGYNGIEEYLNEED